jgi:hypothetical protein
MSEPGISASLRWASAFSGEGNLHERAADQIESLCSCLEDLAISADTAELLLKRDCPGEATSLGAKVKAAKDLLCIARCKTCKGWGRMGYPEGYRPCTDCAPPGSPQVTEVGP